jgi:hypothetical protein
VNLRAAKLIFEIPKTTVTHNNKKCSCCCSFACSCQANITVNNITDSAIFRASLVCIGRSVPASAHIVLPAGQGILFADLVDLANEDITTLCLALRCPCGMIPGTAGVLIRSPGIPVSALAERRLKIVVFLARLFERRINRTFTPVMITAVEIQNAQTLMEHDAACHNPKPGRM